MEFNTFFEDLIVDGFPLESHGLEKFLRVIEFDLFSPGNHEDESEDGVVKVINFESLDDKFGFEVFAVDDAVDDGKDDGLVEFDDGGEQ